MVKAADGRERQYYKAAIKRRRKEHHSKDIFMHYPQIKRLRLELQWSWPTIMADLVNPSVGKRVLEARWKDGMGFTKEELENTWAD